MPERPLAGEQSFAHQRRERSSIFRTLLVIAVVLLQNVLNQRRVEYRAGAILAKNDNIAKLAVEPAQES